MIHNIRIHTDVGDLARAVIEKDSQKDNVGLIYFLDDRIRI